MSTSPKPRWHNAVSGCIAGAGARLVVAPLDLIRIRLQLEPNKTILAHVQQVATESGLRGFFRGNVPATYLWVGYSAVQFSFYAQFSEILNNMAVNKSTTAFCSGALAGVAATLATYPFDICRTNFAAASTGPKTMLDFARDMHRLQGFRGFFAGVVPGLYGIVPYMGFNFLIYETLVGERTSANAGMAGAISGGTSKLLVYPLDTVKKRLQVQAFSSERVRYKSMADCFVKILREEGFVSLYRGILPSVMKNMIATSLSFALYIFAQNTLTSLSTTS
jgi:solute carrier family 25 thiamine pyrophosphate transporter 19